MDFPRSSSHVDTTPLRRMVDRFVGLIIVIIEGGMEPRGMGRAVRYSRDIARLLREIARTEVFNRRMAALEKLASDRAWRESVQAQLGGYWVIKRWARRLRRQTARVSRAPHHAQTSAQGSQALQKSQAIQTPSAAQNPKPRAAVRTAEGGLFRLAPIPRLAAPRAKPPKDMSPKDMPSKDLYVVQSAPARIWRPAKHFKPIALTPELIHIPDNDGPSDHVHPEPEGAKARRAPRYDPPPLRAGPIAAQGAALFSPP